MNADPARFEQFALAYAPALLVSIKGVKAGGWLGKQTPDEYAVSVAMSNLGVLQRAGVEGIAHYYLNAQGGALRSACTELGFEYTPRALQDFLGGKV